jgi:hypothetical protein
MSWPCSKCPAAAETQREILRHEYQVHGLGDSRRFAPDEHWTDVRRQQKAEEDSR